MRRNHPRTGTGISRFGKARCFASARGQPPSTGPPPAEKFPFRRAFAFPRTVRRHFFAPTRDVKAAASPRPPNFHGPIGKTAGQVYQTDVPDKRKARRLEQLFSEIGLEPLETTVAQDASGRVTATVCVPRLSFTADELKVITDEVSTLCRRTFAPAQCIHSGTVTKLLFRERPRFAVDCAVCALPAGGDISADAIQAFPDETGHFHAVLCDGMGTGEPAAGLSTDCVHLLGDLLRAGVAPLDALRILNGTYLLRGDGCFSTVDLLHIDLTSGEAELLKWGAAPSYLRCGDTVKKLGTASLPPGVGVGGDHAPERYRLSLRGGEMLVLVSDGAGDAESAVAGFAGDSPRELAALLIAGLPAEDDMTAVAVALAPRASRD